MINKNLGSLFRGSFVSIIIYFVFFGIEVENNFHKFTQ